MTGILKAMDDAIYVTLTGYPGLNQTTGLKVFHLQPNPGEIVPYVVYYVSAGGFTNTAKRRDVDVDYTIMGWSTDKNEAYQLAEHIDQAMVQAQVAPSGWSNYWVSDGSWITRTEWNDGQQYFGFGGVYNIRADSLTL